MRFIRKAMRGEEVKNFTAKVGRAQRENEYLFQSPESFRKLDADERPDKPTQDRRKATEKCFNEPGSNKKSAFTGVFTCPIPCIWGIVRRRDGSPSYFENG
jgi:hypothetical protein